MQRTLQPELLDSLPSDHPDARHSRRDLVAINALMGNHRWLVRTLAGVCRRGERILEIGAGTGELSRRIARLGLEVAGLDLCPRPADWPETADWHSCDLRTFSGYARYPVIVGNLVFHHFSDAELATIGASIRSTARVIVACETLRRPRSRTLFRLVAPLFGANRVTQHDGDVSIAAGFAGEELPQALGLLPTGTAKAAGWSVRCAEALRGAYHMVAIRR